MKYSVGKIFDGTMDLGSYKHGTQTENKKLIKVEDSPCLLLSSGSWQSIPSSLEYPFYVYENTKGEALESAKNYTLFVVKGDYTYTAKGGGDITDKDRYYAVIVNNPADMNTDNYEGIAKHD